MILIDVDVVCMGFCDVKRVVGLYDIEFVVFCFVYCLK